MPNSHYQLNAAPRPEIADIANALCDLADTLLHTQRIDEAIVRLQQAIAAEPRNVRAYGILGSVLSQMPDQGRAELYLQQTLDIHPQDYYAAYNYGSLLYRLARYREAIIRFRYVLSYLGTHADSHNNIATCQQALGELKDALKSSDIAIKCDPMSYECHFTRAVTLLLNGDFRQGWREYEWRLKSPKAQQRAFSQPRWKGSPLQGKTLLVHCEQGLGDTLQFLRYLPLINREGGRVIFEYQASLASLIAENLGTTDQSDLIFRQQGIAETEDFDYEIPLLSLPAVFQTTLDTIPQGIPYLRAHSDTATLWKERFAQFCGTSPLKIGIVWAGNPENVNDRNRSCGLADFASLASVPGVTLLSLQKGAATVQLTEARFPVIDLAPALEDFADTAAIVANLDLVISVDTSVVHLAGAMGKPVWTLLPYAPDFRWMLGRDDSPWYPTMRLFHQTTPRDWKNVFARVAVTLCNQVGVRCWEAGDVQGALAAFLQALQRDPDDRDTVLNCADVFAAFGQADEAERLLAGYSSRHPQDEEIIERLKDTHPAQAQAA